MTQEHPAEGHSDADVRAILGSVRTIAMVGASANPSKPSYEVLQVLRQAGYDLIPVNPRSDLAEIQGLAVYPSLQSIDRPVDMVDVFRPSREFAAIAREAVDIGAKVLWGQLGIHDDEAARIAAAGGLSVVMDRCPKIELERPSAASEAGGPSD
ncbi:MAG TPA: CoA-binding protein [Gammaproteobacteria bacterium]|nr:CoA-binding protein [Gammaproteobacteria bacterium]